MVQPVKVAHITTVDLSLRYLLLNQLQSLQQVGYEVTGISSPGPDVPVLEATGIRHLSVPMSRNFTPLADLVSLWRLYRVLRRERFTIVHTHTPKPGLLGQLAARIAGVPIVINTLHGFYFHDHMPAFWRRFYIVTEKIAALCSDTILSQNSEDIETAIQEKICTPEKIMHLGNGIDIERFKRSNIDRHRIEQLRKQFKLDTNTHIVGFVGRLVAEKGIFELFQAAKIIKEQYSEIKFLFIGPIDKKKSDAISPQMAQKYGIDDICIFTGMREDMPELYTLMDIFVLPSHREGFPRSPMEASAMEVPCIVTNIRGCREAVEHNRNGLLVPQNNAPALAEAILQLLNNPGLARQMGRAGRLKAEQDFDEQRVFDRVKATYQELLIHKGLVAPIPTENNWQNV